VLIPQQDTLWGGVVHAPELFARQCGGPAANPYGFDFAPARTLAANGWRKGRVKPEQLLTPPQVWARVDYRQCTAPNLHGRLTWVMAKSAIAHGFIVWFDSILAEHIELSNAPSAPELIYGSGFFPWPRPVELLEGERVMIDLAATLVGAGYIWSWSSELFAPGTANASKLQFRQSTFKAVPLNPARLRMRRADYVTALTVDAKIDGLVLELMEQARPLGEIAWRVAADFPDRYPDSQMALDHVADLAQRYGRSENVTINSDNACVRVDR